mgnify:CR=1 FL=1
MDVKGIINSVASAGAPRFARSDAVKQIRPQPPEAPMPAQTRTFIENVSQNQRLSPNERSGMIRMAAVVDNADLSSAARQVQFEKLARLGIYLQETSPTDFPQWPVLTGLRFYSGMHVEVQGADVFNQSPQQVLSAMQDNLMQSSRNISSEQALNSVSSMPQAQLQANISQFVGQNTTSLEVSGMDTSENNQQNASQTRIDKQI